MRGRSNCDRLVQSNQDKVRSTMTVRLESSVSWFKGLFLGRARLFTFLEGGMHVGLNEFKATGIEARNSECI